MEEKQLVGKRYSTVEGKQMEEKQLVGKEIQ